MADNSTMPSAKPFNDPNDDNAEQNESGSQAQDVAADALTRGARLDGESEKAANADPTQITPDDTPDLIDRMNEMEHSGRIDMDAFAGEDNMDDEDGSVPD